MTPEERLRRKKIRWRQKIFANIDPTTFREKKTGRRVSRGTYLTHGDDLYNPGARGKLRIDRRRQYVFRLKLGLPIPEPKTLRELRTREVIRLKVEEGLKNAEIARRILSERDKYLEDGRDYTRMSVYRDIMAAVRAISDDVKGMARILLPQEISRLEQMETKWVPLVDKIADRIDVLLTDEEPRYQDISMMVSSLEKATTAILRIMERRAKYIPIETPRQVDITKKEMMINLEVVTDKLKEWKESSGVQIVGQDFIEGDIIKPEQLPATRIED